MKKNNFFKKLPWGNIFSFISMAASLYPYIIAL